MVGVTPQRVQTGVTLSRTGHIYIDTLLRNGRKIDVPITSPKGDWKVSDSNIFNEQSNVPGGTQRTQES